MQVIIKQLDLAIAEIVGIVNGSFIGQFYAYGSHSEVCMADLSPLHEKHSNKLVAAPHYRYREIIMMSP